MLVDVINHYAASGKLENNAWDMLAKEAAAIGNPTAFVVACESAEAAFRDNHPNEQIPGAWRSAKSVAKSALTLNITLTDTEGVPFGKSFVQGMIKAHKVTADKSPEDAFINACQAACKKGVPYSNAEDYLKSAYGIL